MSEQRRPLQPRDAAARVQRTFRGWRTRRRVVHQVREDMELLAADIRRQVGGEWVLLLGATASPFSLDWGRDSKLRLPRMEDSLFGVPTTLPTVESHGNDEVSCEDGHVTDVTIENCPLADESAADQVVGAQTDQGTREHDGIISETSAVSAVEIRGPALQAETSAVAGHERQAENMDGALLKDGDRQLAGIQKILATHSHAEILLELEWARQALRDRRKYLRSKGRVERNPGPLACA
ncbi:hypothetical protein PRNP1_008816 [Phytophthora ramorum]